MNAIKEFLKPNRWKILIFGTISVIGSLPSLCTVIVWVKYTYLVVSHIPEKLPLFVSLCLGIFPPIRDFLFLGFIGGGTGKVPGRFPGGVDLLTAVIYWYLLACLVYFTFIKVKSLVTRK